MASNKLNDEVKRFIVESLACFDSPTVVAEAVNREFGIKLKRQNIEKYDPTKHAGKGLSQKWKVIFEATREGFISDTRDIGWSHRATRLRVIQRIGEKAERMGNLMVTMQAAEQAAKEVGDVYTNRRQVGGELTFKGLADFYGEGDT